MVERLIPNSRHASGIEMRVRLVFKGVLHAVARPVGDEGLEGARRDKSSGSDGHAREFSRVQEPVDGGSAHREPLANLGDIEE